MSKWAYDRHEILADGIVHALGVVCGLFGVTVLLVLAASTIGPWELTSVTVDAGCLLAVLVISAAYNLWPVLPVKERRFRELCGLLHQMRRQDRESRVE